MMSIQRKVYLKLIHNLAQDLSSEDCKGLSFLTDLSSAAAITHCCCMTHGKASALGLLQKMEEKGVYGPSDLNTLASLLREVGRHDLAAQCTQLTFQAPVQTLRDGPQSQRLSTHPQLQVSAADVDSEGQTCDTSVTSRDYTGAAQLPQATYPRRTENSGHPRPLRCGDHLSLSTGRLNTRQRGHGSAGGRHRSPMPSTQSLDQGQSFEDYVLVDTSRDLQGFDRDHTPTTPDSASSPSSSDELSPDDFLTTSGDGYEARRERSHTVPNLSNGPPISPTRSLPPSAPSHTSTLLPSNPASRLLCGPASPRTLTWTLKRTSFLEPIFNHTAKCIDKKFTLKVGGGRVRSSGCSLTIALKLFPNGLNWALDRSASLKVQVTGHTSSTLYLNMMVEEKGLRHSHMLVSRRKVCKLAKERAFLIEEFLAHDVLKMSSAKNFLLTLDVELGYRLGEDWVCIGTDSSLGCCL